MKERGRGWEGGRKGGRERSCAHIMVKKFKDKYGNRKTQKKKSGGGRGDGGGVEKRFVMPWQSSTWRARR